MKKKICGWDCIFSLAHCQYGPLNNSWVQNWWGNNPANKRKTLVGQSTRESAGEFIIPSGRERTRNREITNWVLSQTRLTQTTTFASPLPNGLEFLKLTFKKSGSNIGGKQLKLWCGIPWGLTYGYIIIPAIILFLKHVLLHSQADESISDTLTVLIIFVYSFWNPNTSSQKPYDKNYNFIQRSGWNNLHVKMPAF